MIKLGYGGRGGQPKYYMLTGLPFVNGFKPKPGYGK